MAKKENPKKAEEKKPTDEKLQKKMIGEIVGGAILIVIAVWLFLTSVTIYDGKMLGGAILAILGIAAIVVGIVGLTKK
ncbi:hypothetical protein KY345_00645 [Candidatus Woesearchaeota archaeon]|nr:hypothetical protein [Candidatus Woesearchaeota archaeon]